MSPADVKLSVATPVVPAFDVATGATDDLARPLEPLPVEALRAPLEPAGWRRLNEALHAARRPLAGRTLWMINSTAVGGGVAELLRSLLPYWRAAGLDVRWLVLRAPPRFFTITKRLHNWLHGHPGDGGPLGARERRVYERVLAANAEPVVARIRAGDLVVLHDAQTAGLVRSLAAAGATVVWRSHVGADRPNELTRAAWRFLERDVERAAALVFQRRAAVPPELHGLPVSLIPPCIDPCATKSLELPADTCAAILAAAGIATATTGAAPAVVGRDGRRVVMRQRSAIRRAGPAPRVGHDPIVAHITRWDRLKDPAGVVECFADHVADAHLVVAGPALHAVSDDPESAEVYRDVERRWERLRPAKRRRIHLVRLPMRDVDANASVVNALQRSADVVFKKSFEEGFGLGVTEAMWKRRAVVASAVGGHRDQIEDGVSGKLVDPRDLPAAGAAIVEVLQDPARARGFGEAARARVHDRYLPDRHFEAWLGLLTALAAD